MGTEFHELCVHVFLGNIVKPQTKQNVRTAATLAFHILSSQILKKVPIRKSVSMYRLKSLYLL